MTQTKKGTGTMKTKRQNEIIRIISAEDIETQEELASELRALGYKVTQATVSRDIRELRQIKVAAKEGGFKYAKPERHEIAVSERLTRILTDSLIKPFRDPVFLIFVINTVGKNGMFLFLLIRGMQSPPPFSEEANCF